MAKSDSFAGFDLAPNHSAYVEVNSRGKVIFFSAITNSVRVDKENPEVTLYHITKIRKRLPKEVYKIHRLAFFSSWFSEIVDSRRPTCVCVEAYAYGKNTGAYEIGEVGGAARTTLLRSGIPFRLWSPMSVKKFAGIPASEKPFKFCLSKGEDWKRINSGTKSDTAGDLADSHCLALMALTEHKLKTGKLKDVPPTFKNIMDSEFLSSKILELEI